MRRALLYIHGKGGSAQEAQQLRPHCTGYDVQGVDWTEMTPWGAEGPIRTAFAALEKRYGAVAVAANSIGAYFAMFALREYRPERAFFISPILDMERLIMDMMSWAQVTESQLREQGEIPTSFGETLSWEYLVFVRNHPIRWEVPTEILCGERDHMTAAETVRSFAAEHHAGVTVMPGGEHWFHTPQQLEFMGKWLERVCGQEHRR